MWVAVDVMSGDYGIEPLLQGAIMAINDFDAKIILVGDDALLRANLPRHNKLRDNLQICHCDEIISMEETPARAVQLKRNASVVVAARQVRDQNAVGFFSAGNTGATMVAAISELGCLTKVERPAIASVIPRYNRAPLVLIDSGANVECNAANLVQFAIMGEVYSREILAIANPKIGILSNGSESKKGNKLTKAVFEQLKKLPFDFVGNIESHDFFDCENRVDVVTCDGFTGNIAIKAIEGTAKSISASLSEEIKKSHLAKAGSMFMRKSLASLKDKMDYATYGGAPLLGVNGVCIIGHGSSSALAVRNAVRVVLDFAKYQVEGQIEENIHKYSL